jgi:hypothetical protein
MADIIWLLEDDGHRVARMRRCVQQLTPPPRLLHWASARRMLRECGPPPPACRLICLDHDLYPAPGDPEDPGDGLEVATSLAPLAGQVPILIHSSNADRVARMVGVFQLHGVRVETVLPFGQEWVERWWLPKVISLLTPGPAKG